MKDIMSSSPNTSPAVSGARYGNELGRNMYADLLRQLLHHANMSSRVTRPVAIPDIYSRMTNADVHGDQHHDGESIKTLYLDTNVMSSVEETLELCVVEMIGPVTYPSSVIYPYENIHSDILDLIGGRTDSFFDEFLSTSLSGEIGQMLTTMEVLHHCMRKHMKPTETDTHSHDRYLSPIEFTVYRAMYKRVLGDVYRKYEVLFINVFPLRKESILDFHKGNIDLLHHEIMLILLSIIVMHQHQLYWQFFDRHFHRCVLSYADSALVPKASRYLCQSSTLFIIDYVLSYYGKHVSPVVGGLMDTDAARLDLLVIIGGMVPARRFGESAVQLVHADTDTSKDGLNIWEGDVEHDDETYRRDSFLLLQTRFAPDPNQTRLSLLTNMAVPNDLTIVGDEADPDLIAIETLYPSVEYSDTSLIFTGDWINVCREHMEYGCITCLVGVNLRFVSEFNMSVEQYMAEFTSLHSELDHEIATTGSGEKTFDMSSLEDRRIQRRSSRRASRRAHSMVLRSSSRSSSSRSSSSSSSRSSSSHRSSMRSSPSVLLSASRGLRYMDAESYTGIHRNPACDKNLATYCHINAPSRINVMSLENMSSQLPASMQTTKPETLHRRNGLSGVASIHRLMEPVRETYTELSMNSFERM